MLEFFTCSDLLQWIKNMTNLPHTTAILTEVSLNLIQFSLETLLAVDSFCCVCQGEQQCLTVYWMVEEPSIQIQIGVHRLSV